ncbi:MAG: Ig-like domain-containing protein [Chloroflexi bacterium]|nr:Ig-like domain-containing protein [Chloroflexota bacterium]
MKEAGSLDHESAASHTVTVRASDDSNAFDTITVTITVTDVNEPPEAEDDSATVTEDESVTIDVLANDSDPEDAPSDLTVSAGTARNGQVVINVPQNPGERYTITYTPRADYHGADTFTYTVRDGGSPSRSDSANVSVNVISVNDDPTFGPGAAARSVPESSGEGENVGAPVTASDVDGDRLAYSLFGVDAGSFDIDLRSGQITVGTGVAFDIVVRDAYTVTVEADDTNGGRASVEVTITVTTGPVGLPITGGGGGGGGGGGPTGPTPSKADFEWTVKHDIEALASGHDSPTGMWSDGATLWLLHNGDGADDAVYAYDLETGERAEDREFALDERNRAPRGIWSDGKGNVWVSDSGRDKLFAYDIATGDRLEDRDLELAERNADARGIWSDGETMWVLDGGKDSLFAYDLATGDFLAEYALDSRDSDPRGMWSDGVTLWVSDPGSSPRRLFAYRLPTREEVEAAGEDASLERVRDEEFDGLSQASNNSPRGIWSDGDFLYVADASDGKVYSYNMPDAIDARLASLTLSGIEIGAFDPARTDYRGVIREGVTETTVVAEAVQRRTESEVKPDDADGDDTNGHQVALQGLEDVTVTVTSSDGSRQRVYRVTFEPTVKTLALGPTWTSFEWPGPDGAPIAEAGLPEGVVAVYTWDESTGSWLGYFPGLEDVPGLNTLTTFSSGATYWVVAEKAVIWTLGRSEADEE